ncbi:receptor-like protein EIX1 [Vitis vinifera]|uniref:receptor-like protein EIX1 n=1 Tax=Vitis vinifera TaxID=29760 RepID=UPI002883281A|nr:receptor-like protein EIX1 [Vitis vinifera]
MWPLNSTASPSGGPNSMANNNVFIQLLFLIITSSGFLFHDTIKVGSCQGDHQRGCVDTEKVALLKFKQGLTDTSDRLSSWVGEDCCKWRGVVCNNRSRHVIKLTLRYLDADGTEGELGGKISPALLELKYLNYLDLSMNNFGGTPIPKFIGSLEKLRYLNLSGASFGGPIPPQLGNLSSLHYLDLKEYFDESNQNDLHWISGLTSLRHLNLGGVDLSQAAAYWLQAVSKLPSLSELHLPACALADLPPSLPFSNLITSLSIIDLSNNGFNSTIPHWLFQMRNLVYLDLSSNNLRGSILDAFANGTSIERLRNMGSLCNLKTLILSQNDLNGEITELIDVLSGCNSSWLETLDLGFNDLGGFLPNSLGKLHNLKSLWLWDNSFVGSIPSSIGNLSYLEELYLSDNSMNGTIPETLGRLSKLVAIELSENPLTGVVTEAHFSNLTSLKEFSNYRGTPRVSLVFNINPEWIPPFKLSLLRIRSCQLGPKFPAWLRNQTELTDVVLNNAGISDSIPKWFWKLDLHLDELDIGSNNLGGRVPNSMKFLPESTVDLSENNFQGPLPLWSSNVTKLYLNDNFFSSHIPLEYGERMSMVTDLDLSNNDLNGTIPLSFGKLNNLLTLVISNNHFSGGIPEFWNGLPYLYVVTSQMAPKKTVSSVRVSEAGEKAIDKLDVKEFRERFCIPNDVYINLVNEEATMPTEKGEENVILFTKEQFNAGLRFPLPAFIINMLYSLDLTLLEVFFIYSLKKAKNDIFSVSAHLPSLQVVIELPDSTKGGAKGLVAVRGGWAGLSERVSRPFSPNYTLKIPGLELRGHLVDWVEKASFACVCKLFEIDPKERAYKTLLSARNLIVVVRESQEYEAKEADGERRRKLLEDRD